MVNNGLDPAYQRCSSCGYSVFNNPVGATEAVIIRNEKTLMVKRAQQPRRGYWDFPGGFLDGHETPEHGIIREVREETGLIFRPKRLVGVYNNTQYWWHGRFAPCIVISFIGTASGRLALQHEATEAQWIDIRDKPRMAFSYHARVLRDIGKIRSKV